MTDDFADILYHRFLQKATVSSSGMSRDAHGLDVVHQAFPLPITVSPILQDTLKDGFGEAVEACDMPEACHINNH